MPSCVARSSSAMALKRKAVFLCLLVLSPVCSGDICREDRELTVTEGDPLSLTCEVANKNRVDVFWRPDGNKSVPLGLCHSVYNHWSCIPKDFCKLDVLGQSGIKLTIRQDLLSTPGGTMTCVKHWGDGQLYTRRGRQSCRIRVKPRESTTTEPTTTEPTTTEPTTTEPTARPVAITRTLSPTLRPFTASAVTVAARNGADNDINDNDNSTPTALIVGVTVGTLLVIIVIIAVIIIVFKRRRGSPDASGPMPQSPDSDVDYLEPVPHRVGRSGPCSSTEQDFVYSEVNPATMTDAARAPVPGANRQRRNGSRVVLILHELYESLRMAEVGEGSVYSSLGKHGTQVPVARVTAPSNKCLIQ